MFRKINNVFRPNHHHHQGHRSSRDGGIGGGIGGRFRSEQEDYHNACTVRLVRSTSMLVVGERRTQESTDASSPSEGSSTLKRSKSTVSVESTLYYYYQRREEDRLWLYSQNQNCLEYLEALVALRRQYTKSVGDFKSSEETSNKATVSSKKKAAAPPPPKEKIISRSGPSAPPVPDEENTLQFFDSVIASCDNEPLRKPYTDDGHADVDFIVASSSAEHDLHSNWVLRVPRVADDPQHRAVCQDSAKEKPQKKKKKSQGGSTSSRLRLQRNPIHLPKVVESAFQTLRFKPKLKKQ